MHVCVYENNNYKSVFVNCNTMVTEISMKLSQILKNVVGWNPINAKY